MTQVKILVHNINDVVHRAAFETELNVYLKMDWRIRDTHQAVSPETGFLMMTAVLEKEAEEKEPVGDRKQEAVKEPEKGSPEAKEQQAVKQPAEEKEEKEPDEDKGPVKEGSEGTEHKGFKIKEKKEASASPDTTSNEKEAEPEKDEAGEKEEKE